jgi:pimeloyl-ACP methyl ester carboxylesterase
MKQYIKYLMVCIVLIFISSNLYAQRKIAVFVHGFEGNGQKWLTASKVPQGFLNNRTISDYVILQYETEELSTKESQKELLDRFAQQMRAVGNPASDEWILIGHSLGGIVSRLLYPAFRNIGFNVKAVVSVGGPLQGARATDVNLRYINSEFNRLKREFKKATDHEYWTVTFAINFASLFSSNSPRKILNSIPDKLDIARDSVLGMAKLIKNTDAKALIGLNGSLIKTINSYPSTNYDVHPEHYLSVGGAEKTPIPFRLASYIFTPNQQGDEYMVVKQLNTFENKYLSKNVDKWRRLAKRYHWCRFKKSCRRSRDAANRKKGYWETARTSFNNLTTVWSTMINSYRLVNKSYQVYLPSCLDRPHEGLMFDLELKEKDCVNGPGRWVTRYTTIQVPDKNDGVVSLHSTLWNANHQIGDYRNLYLSDQGLDGGYNHYELYHHKRSYTLPGVFNKGKENPPMQKVENWIKNGYKF